MPTPCPSEETLLRHVNGELEAADEQQITEHLDECSSCQQTLEAIAAAGDSLLSAARHAGEEPSRHKADVQEILQDLKERNKNADSTLAFEEANAGESLDFLSPSDKPGHLGRLDHYEILEVVGQGGMGVVLKALDEKLHRIVAVKVMSADLAAGASARSRFNREAKSAAAVAHDHVVTIHAVEDKHRPPYLVMEFVEGKSLQQRLDEVGPLDLKEILRIGHQTACGLAASHKQGLVHRDIKPANILLENGIERVKITDFGLARAIDDASITQSGVITGTPMYMSPEQAGGESVDHRSDLFSLGSVLYAMCTGRPPFRASGTMAVMKRVCEEEPRPIREINPDIPPGLCGIIAKLHAKVPEERFQSAAAVATLLEQHLAHLQQPNEVNMPQAVARPTTKAATWRLPLWPIVLIGVILLMCLSALLILKATQSGGLVQHWPITLFFGLGAVAIYGFVFYWWVQPRKIRQRQSAAPFTAPAHPKRNRVVQPFWLILWLTGGAALSLLFLIVLPDVIKRIFYRDYYHLNSWQVLAVAGLGTALAVWLWILPWLLTFGGWRFQYFARGSGLFVFIACLVPMGFLIWYESSTAEIFVTSDAKDAAIFIKARFGDGKGNGPRRVGMYGPIRIRPGLCVVWAVPINKLQGLPSGSWRDQRIAFLDKICFFRKVYEFRFGERKSIQASEKPAALNPFVKVAKTWSQRNGNFAVVGLAVSPNGKWVAGAGSRYVRLWSLITSKTNEMQHAERLSVIHDVAFSPDGKRFTWSEGGGRLGRGAPGAALITKPFGHFKKHNSDALPGLAYSPTGDHIVAGSSCGNLLLWDAKAGGKPIAVVPVRLGNSILDVAWSPLGNRIASAGGDGQVILWDVKRFGETIDLEVVHKLTFSDATQAHMGNVRSVAFSPDGEKLISGGDDGKYRIWDVTTGKERTSGFPAERRTILAVGWSPDGSHYALADDDKTIWIFDAQSHNLRANLTKADGGHANAILSMTFSPDGKYLISGSVDAVIKVWEFGKPLAPEEKVEIVIDAKPDYFDGRKVEFKIFRESWKRIGPSGNAATGKMQLVRIINKPGRHVLKLPAGHYRTQEYHDNKFAVNEGFTLRPGTRTSQTYGKNDANWVRLFDARDLSAWKGDTSNWSWHGEELRCDNIGKHLAKEVIIWSPKKYKDFELKFSVSSNATGNCGVYIRGKPRAQVGNPLQGSPEVSLASTQLGSFYTRGGFEGFLKRADRDAVRKVQKIGFNEIHVRCHGKRVTIRVNGLTTIDEEFPVIPDEGVIAFWAQSFAQPAKPKPPVGTRISFRDIRIRELKHSDGTDWTQLFNGKDLTGWTHGKQKAIWKVENGNLVGKGSKASNLLTERGDFEDFHFRAEVKLNDRGKCGIFVRRHPDSFKPQPGKHVLIGYAINLSTGTKEQVDQQTPDPATNLGLTRDRLIEADKWTTVDLLSRANLVTIKVDGKLVADCFDFDYFNKKGHIVLQQLIPNTVAQFRNIEIKELPREPLPLPSLNQQIPMDRWIAAFNGKDLKGWHILSGRPGGWQVKNGELIASGERGPLYFDRDDIRDFHLRMEAMIERGPVDAGVLFHCDHDSDPTGFLAQIIDDPKERAKTGSLRGTTDSDRPRVPLGQYSPEVFKHIVERSLVTPGQWFALEVISDGSRMQVKVNGITTANHDASSSHGGFGVYHGQGNLALRHPGEKGKLRIRKIELKRPLDAYHPIKKLREQAMALDKLPFADSFDMPNFWLRDRAGTWAIVTTKDRRFLSLLKPRSYRRSEAPRPSARALLARHLKVTDFTLECDLQCTRKADHKERDLCIIFGYQRPDRYYFVHLAGDAGAMNPKANQIYLVDGKQTKAITKTNTHKKSWNEGWHKVKIVREVKSGRIEVYFDDMNSPVMTAVDDTLTWGQVGLGAHNDTGNFDNFRLQGTK